MVQAAFCTPIKRESKTGKILIFCETWHGHISLASIMEISFHSWDVLYPVFIFFHYNKAVNITFRVCSSQFFVCFFKISFYKFNLHQTLAITTKMSHPPLGWPKQVLRFFLYHAKNFVFVISTSHMGGHINFFSSLSQNARGSDFGFPLFRLVPKHSAVHYWASTGHLDGRSCLGISLVRMTNARPVCRAVDVRKKTVSAMRSGSLCLFASKLPS